MKKKTIRVLLIPSVIIFFLFAFGFVGKNDLDFKIQNDEWEAENLPHPAAVDVRAEEDYNPFHHDIVDKQWGIASWYDYKVEPEIDENGLFTGEDIVSPCPTTDPDWKAGDCITRKNSFAASRRFNRGDVLQVTNPQTGRFINVIVTDYIEHPERIIDLSSFAFAQLAPLEVGLIDVEVELIGNVNDVEPTKTL